MSCSTWDTSLRDLCIMPLLVGMLHSFRSLNFAQSKASDKQFSRCSKQKVAWCYYLSCKFGLHNTGGALSCFLTNFFDTPHAYQKAGEIIFISKEKKARGSYRKKCRGVEGLKVIHNPSPYKDLDQRLLYLSLLFIANFVNSKHVTLHDDISVTRTI